MNNVYSHAYLHCCGVDRFEVVRKDSVYEQNCRRATRFKVSKARVDPTAHPPTAKLLQQKFGDFISQITNPFDDIDTL